MSIFTTIKNFFVGNAPAIKKVVIDEVDQVVALLAPAVSAPLAAIINTLEASTQSNADKLFTLADEAIAAVKAAKNVVISKSLGIAVAQKVYLDVKTAAIAEARTLLAKL